MSDVFLEIGQNRHARQVIKSLGLPLPMPQPLRRAGGAWEERPLQDSKVVVGQSPGGALGTAMAVTLTRAGGNPWIVGHEPALREAFRGPGEAFGRPAQHGAISELEGDGKLHGLVFDASGLELPEQLRAVYEFFHPLLSGLPACGRVVVLGRAPESSSTPEAAATCAALEGFVRSLAKEVGKRGSTANLIQVEAGAEDRVEPVLRFLLSKRAAFVTGQKLRLSGRVLAQQGTVFSHVLEGKIALVTGAARGIGQATAELLAAQGAHVVCLDRPADDEPVSRVARAVGGTPLLIDIANPEAPERIAQELESRHRGVDIIVHNAGITRDKTLARMKPEAWDQVIDINLSAVTRITRRLARSVLHDQGRVICLSSVAGIAGNMGQTNYAASKAGIIGFVGQAASDLAGRGITVNAIAPGFIETRMTAAIPVVIREVARRLSALGQGGMPVDVAEAVTFLASPGASGLTGSVVRVCGGAFVGA